MLAYYNVVDIAPGIKRINSEEGSACDLIIGTKKAGLIEGDEFDLGGITIKVFVAPGHSVGSRAYFVPERKILYVGDSIGRTISHVMVFKVFIMLFRMKKILLA